jgi:hypothetical protein
MEYCDGSDEVIETDEEYEARTGQCTGCGTFKRNGECPNCTGNY